jgi:hypothetical protein
MANIFMQVHETREGKSLPIVSMGDDHLYNTIFLNLVKKPDRAIQQFMDENLREYAPEDMDDRTRRSLGLRKLTNKVKGQYEEALEELKDKSLEISLEKMLPYLVVALCRNTLHLKVRQLLIDLTGITQQVNLPQFMEYPVLTEEDVLELTGGHPFEEDFERFHGFGDDE